MVMCCTICEVVSVVRRQWQSRLDSNRVRQTFAVAIIEAPCMACATNVSYGRSCSKLLIFSIRPFDLCVEKSFCSLT